MNKNMIMVTIALATGIALSGCSGNNSNTDSVDKNETEYANVYPTEVKTKDGHTVQCVVMEGYKAGGLTCDWDNKK